MGNEERLGVKEIYIEAPADSFLEELIAEAAGDEEAIGYVVLEISKLALRTALRSISKKNNSFAESFARLKEEEMLDSIVEDIVLRTVEYEVDEHGLELYIDLDGIKKYLSDYGITHADVQDIYKMFEYLSDKGFPALDLYLMRTLEEAITEKEVYEDESKGYELEEDEYEEEEDEYIDELEEDEYEDELEEEDYDDELSEKKFIKEEESGGKGNTFKMEDTDKKYPTIFDILEDIDED